MSKDDPWRVYEEEIASKTILKQSVNGHSHRRTGARSPRSSAGTLRLDEIRSVLTTALSEACWTSHVEEMFKKMVASNGYVSWEKLCTYILQQQKHNGDSSEINHDVFSSEPLIRHCLYNKQEPITRIVEVNHPPPLRYVTVSKGGNLIVWNSHLHAMKTLELSGDPGEKSGLHRQFKSWTTDAVYMPNMHKMAVATMSRDIRIFDVSSSVCSEEFRLFGLSHVATTLCYWYDVKAPGERCVLIWGDEKGSVNLLWFLQPHKGLFETPFSDQSGPKLVFFPDICRQTLMVSYMQPPKMHNELINRIIYEPHANLLVTSSESATSSLVIMDINQRRNNYIWKIDKGVRCFDISWPLNLLVTAGLESSIRMWNRYVTSRPVAVLHGHATTVVDVLVHQALAKIFSYSKDAVLKIWDIQSQYCVKTVPLRFPNIQTGYSPEQGSFPLLLSRAGGHTLLVSCREYLALIRLRPVGSKDGPKTFSCTLYIPDLKQVVAACVDSSLVVWDVTTGRKHIEVKNAHGHEEITALAADPGQQRLITAAANGTIKVWNLLNGQPLHNLEAVSDTEVTGVICLHDNKLLALGWSQVVAQYNIGDLQDTHVRAGELWKCGRLHSDDILAVDHCPSLRLLATGSYDGEIIIWMVETQRPVTRIQRPQTGRVCPPIDRLLFLQKRAQDRRCRGRAILLSSQGGYVCWWNVSGSKRKHGQFYVPHRDNECVKGLSTNVDNSLLITGDGSGSIQIWNISQYALSDELVNKQPPLQHAWKAHTGAIVSMEVLEQSGQLFLVSMSVDHTARVWTSDGGCVGSFGQGQLWELSNPHTYQVSREINSPAREEEKDRTEMSKSELTKSNSDLTVWGQSSRGSARVNRIFSKDFCQQTASVPNPEEHPSLHTSNRESRAELLSSSDSFSPVLQSKETIWDHMSLDLEKKMAIRQDRRLVFGDIDSTKLYRIGNECTPFQALKTVEMSQPEDIPTRPEVLSRSQGYSRATDLSSALLSSDSSGHSGTFSD
ncbi:cilia- and flagella-associated protein 337 isoform X2 [Brachyhypopomus gauderio]|uniref:cilia- and flagella-associated protein 337 isoform X2 n=1 Tax=Brachyhypopomus gauderio TaxID=698409 RepID=UPI0040417ADF